MDTDTSEIDLASAAIDRTRREEGPAEVAEAERWLQMAEHEALLVAGARVRVTARPGRSVRLEGTEACVVGRESGRVFEVTADGGFRLLVDSRDLALV